MCLASACCTLRATNTSGETVQALDATMEAALRDGRTPSAAEFGGIAAILASADGIAHSHFVPEYMALVLDEADLDDPGVQAFSRGVVQGLDGDIGINALVDLVAERTPLPDAVEAVWFRRWLDLAQDRTAAASARIAALRGALLTKRQDARRSLRLSSVIADCAIDDEPAFLAHAARIAGLLHAESPSEALVDFLNDLLEVADAADEASFELGMERVGLALQAGSGRDVLARLREARTRFDASASGREARADARVLSLAIGLLDDFFEERIGGWTERLEELRREAFAHSAYAIQEGDFLNGAKEAEVSAWASLAVRLGSLADSLEEPAWWNAAHIIENELLSVYSANRTLFRRSVDGGLEWLVRPRIEGYYARHRDQLYALRGWLKARGSSELGTAAADLIVRTDAALGRGGDPDPPGAATASPAVAAVLESGKDSYEDRERYLREVIADVNYVEFKQITPPVMEAVKAVLHAFEGLPYFDNPNVRVFVRAVVVKTLLFLKSRMDPSPGVDPTVSYLFIREGEPNPLEKSLQQDFMRFLHTSMLGSVDEVRGIAAGRADVMHQFEGIRFITEIKREEQDASLENLIASYGAQTTLYQNTNIPIGILLVLDLTTRDGLSGHFRTLYRTEIGDLLRDGTTRGVLVVKIPARRVDPSTATREATSRISKAKTASQRDGKPAAKVMAPKDHGAQTVDTSLAPRFRGRRKIHSRPSRDV